MNYNHVCSLESKKVFYTTKGARFSLTSISTKNPKTKSYFRSMASIEKEKIRHEAKYSYIVHPMSILRFCWIVSYTCLVYISLVIIPINIILDKNHPTRQWLQLFETILDLFCFVDVIFTFLVGIPFAKEIELRPGYIARYHLQRPQFYIDCITSVPKHFTSLSVDSLRSKWLSSVMDYLKYYSLVKILRMKKLLAYYNDIMENFQNYYFLQSLFKYVLLALLSLHWATCLYIVALFSNHHLDSDYNQLVPSFEHTHLIITNYVSLYCKSLYIVTSYVLANGVVRNFKSSIQFQMVKLTDVIIFIFLSIAGFITCTFLLVSLLQITLSMNSSESKYHAIVSQVKKYISHKDLPADIRDRILTYYEYRYRKRYFREKKILDMLSETLRRDIYLHSCRTLIENVALLKDLPSEIIAEVVSNLKHEVFLYNDIIVKAGSPGDCMFFIANGSVSVSTPTRKEICHLQDGAYFGEIALVSKDQKRVANVVAIEICEIYRLHRKHFKSSFSINSNHYKKLEQTAKERKEKTMLLEELHKKYIMEKSQRTIHTQAKRSRRPESRSNI